MLGKKNSILFYAPVGNGVPPHLLGGGEKGCRRTREILCNAGYEVITIDKPNMGRGGFEYIKSAINAYLNILKKLILDKTAILYVVGFYEKNIYMEFLNVLTGKFFGHKVIYEARNGRLVKAYREYGNGYKYLMDFVLKKANVVFVQGLEYADFIYEKYQREAIYTPNYVMNRSLKPYVVDRPFNVIRLLYFGRVSESKNVDIVIKTAAVLEENGYKTSTVIIGGYTDDYKKKLDQLVTKLGIPIEAIRFTGQQNFEVVVDELQNAHFFVFPSQEKMEGHSNALTEAMTFGVVPIVSGAGFNASICGKNELVVEKIEASSFAAVIIDVLDNKRWEELSRFVYLRVKENYTEDIVRNSILAAIE